jgi:hypothetical protein
MSQDALTASEKRFAQFMGACAVVYALGALAFPTVGDALLGAFNQLLPGDPVRMPSERFWVVLASAMMAAISVASWLVYRDPVGRADLALPVAASKVTSSLLGIAFWAGAPAGSRPTAYLLIALTDLPLFFATLGLWRAAQRSREPNRAGAAAATP